MDASRGCNLAVGSTGLERFGRGVRDAAHVLGLLGSPEGVTGSAAADGAFEGEPTEGDAACDTARRFVSS